MTLDMQTQFVDGVTLVDEYNILFIASVLFVKYG